MTSAPPARTSVREATVTHVLRTARGLRGLAGVTGACIVAALAAAPPAYAASVQPVISAATGGRQMTAAERRTLGHLHQRGRQRRQ
jgi:hypothetical protein